jgi:hypothetical protein
VKALLVLLAAATPLAAQRPTTPDAQTVTIVRSKDSLVTVRGKNFAGTIGRQVAETIAVAIDSHGYPYRHYGPLRIVQLPAAVEGRIAAIDTVLGAPRKQSGSCDWKPIPSRRGLDPIYGEYHVETCEARVFFIGTNRVPPPPPRRGPPPARARPWLDPKVKVNSKREVTVPRKADGKCDWNVAYNSLGGPPPKGTTHWIGDLGETTCTVALYNLTLPRPLFGDAALQTDSAVSRSPDR